jgi:hypothetical protein
MESLLLIYFIGVIIAFILVLSDYVLLNMRLGFSINSILSFIFNDIDNIMGLLTISLGSWITVIGILTSDKHE